VALDLIKQDAGSGGPRLLLVEPYLTASHAAFAQGLMRHVPARWSLLGLPGRHWRWRMRGAAAFLADQAAEELAQPWDGLVASDMLGLAELRGLVPGLAAVPALVVFHENQLAYPAPGRAEKSLRERDLYLAFSNLTSALAARRVVFNSRFHRDEFLGAARELVGRLPDMRPLGLPQAIAAKSRVLPMPIDPGEVDGLTREPRRGPLRILWNHRWAQDKAPEEFFAALEGLAAQGLEFEVAVLGPAPAQPPAVFAQAREALARHIVQWGHARARNLYWKCLFWADVVVSTARQEYFGMSVAEAAWAGCRPLVPDALVYPQLYPARFCYPPGELAERLAELAQEPEATRQEDYRPLAQNFTWQSQAPAWQKVIAQTIEET
jgi:glycosyltransferase involved in cell wall biosynthesis